MGSCSQAICNPLINTSDNRISGGQNYSYDANGNLTQDATGKQFLYDAENHQKQVKDANNVIIGEYLYDGEGKRVKKISSTEITVFVYNGGGTLVAEYSTAIAQTPQVSYLTADHLGSARVITNQNGAVTTRKDYMAFGDEASSAQRTNGLNYDSSETRKGYTGYEKDIESGLEFAQARYYNSIHGRYTSIDPLTASANVKNPQTFNRYSYVLNSPYKFVDPLGLISSSTGACGSWCPGNGSSLPGGGGAFSGGNYKAEEESSEGTAGDMPTQQTAEQAEDPPQRSIDLLPKEIADKIREEFGEGAKFTYVDREGNTKHVRLTNSSKLVDKAADAALKVYKDSKEHGNNLQVTENNNGVAPQGVDLAVNESTLDQSIGKLTDSVGTDISNTNVDIETLNGGNMKYEPGGNGKIEVDVAKERLGGILEKTRNIGVRDGRKNAPTPRVQFGKGEAKGTIQPEVFRY